MIYFSDNITIILFGCHMGGGICSAVETLLLRAAAYLTF